MSTALAPHNGAPLAPDDYGREKVELIKKTVAKGATDLDLELFLYQCKRTGLDPLTRQIYWVQRGGVGTIQTGIDGYRLIADRTGLYAGNDDPVFGGEHFLGAEGAEAAAPEQATVTVWKFVHGQRCPFTATARWKEYYPGDKQGQMWRRMPFLMLSKCAEALALRKAFPAELSGLYTDTEMDQAGEPSAPAPAPVRSGAAPRPAAPAGGPRLGAGLEAPADRLERYRQAYSDRVREAVALGVPWVKLPHDADVNTIIDMGVALKDALDAKRSAEEGR